MFIYFLSDWGRISNLSDPNYLKVLKFLSSKAQFRWCKLGSSPFFFPLWKGETILVYYSGWPKERSCTAQPSQDNGALCTLIFIFPASRRWPGADTEGEWTQGEGNGELSSTKSNIHWLSWHFDSTGCYKIGGFCWKTEFWVHSVWLGLSAQWDLQEPGTLFERSSAHVLCVFKWFPQHQGVWDYLRFGTVSFCIYLLLLLFVKLTRGQFLFPLPEIPNNSPDPYMIIAGSCCCKWQQNCSLASVCFASSADWFSLGILWIALAFLCSLEKQPSPCTGEGPGGCTQVSSPAGHNSDLISGIPCTGT